jgi:FkbM family methyltransferase
MIRNNTIVLIPDTLTSIQNSIDINPLLLSEAKGMTKKDKLVLFSLKNIYLVSRILSRIILGKKKTDRLYTERGISFKSFLYKYIEILGLDNSFLIVFNVPAYNYKFSSLVTRKVPHFLIEEMYVSMAVPYEEDILKHFNPKKGDVVIDIGAAFGLYTILSSKRVGSNGKVIAIEAHPSCFEMLNRNIKLNGLTNVIPLNNAVHSRKMKVKLYSNYTIMSERVSKDKANEKFIQVNANTLDNLLQQNEISHADINWIKIDVEGAEFEVLKGATSILSKSKDIALLIEVHGKDNYKPVVEFLKTYNFKIEFEKTYGNREKHILVRKS